MFRLYYPDGETVKSHSETIGIMLFQDLSSVDLFLCYIAKNYKLKEVLCLEEEKHIADICNLNGIDELTKEKRLNDFYNKKLTENRIISPPYGTICCNYIKVLGTIRIKDYGGGKF